MSKNVEDLHKQMMEMPLRDLLFLTIKALDADLDTKRLSIILRYVENAIVDWRLKQDKP